MYIEDASISGQLLLLMFCFDFLITISWVCTHIKKHSSSRFWTSDIGWECEMYQLDQENLLYGLLVFSSKSHVFHDSLFYLWKETLLEEKNSAYRENTWIRGYLKFIQIYLCKKVARCSKANQTNLWEYIYF